MPEDKRKVQNRRLGESTSMTKTQAQEKVGKNGNTNTSNKARKKIKGGSKQKGVKKSCGNGNRKKPTAVHTQKKGKPFRGQRKLDLH